MGYKTNVTSLIKEKRVLHSCSRPVVHIIEGLRINIPRREHTVCMNGRIGIPRRKVFPLSLTSHPLSISKKIPMLDGTRALEYKRKS